jgi:hypothetical protein
MWSASPGRFCGLFAQFRFDLDLIILSVLLFGIIVGGVVLVAKARHWRTEDPQPPSLEEQLQSFQALVQRGEMDAKEFERLKAYLEQKAGTPPPSNTDGSGTQ